MIVYKVYFKDYSLKKGKLLGVLSERRNDLRGESYFESGLRWARLTFGPLLKDKQSLFVVPQELEEGDGTRELMEKEIFSEREFLNMMRSCAPTGRIPINTTLERVEATLPVHRDETSGTRNEDRIAGAALPQALESIAASSSYPAIAAQDEHPDDLLMNSPSKDFPRNASEFVSYAQFYGFSEKPFEGIPDHKGFYFSPSHRDALALMIDGIANQVGYVTVTGDAGTGKTALIHLLPTSLGKTVKTVLISYTPFNVTELITGILIELALESVKESEEGVRVQLHECLIRESFKNKSLVVVIDDAQDLSTQLVGELGTLLEEEKQLQVVFVGRCEFEEKLRIQEGRKVWKGKGIRCRMRSLNQKESKKYMDHRLRQVGSSLSTVFTPKAVSMIVGHADGIPRLVNILCTHAFLMGCEQGRRKIDGNLISKVIKEVEEGNLLGLLRHRYRA
jgi:general secretion pathway protein A